MAPQEREMIMSGFVQSTSGWRGARVARFWLTGCGGLGLVLSLAACSKPATVSAETAPGAPEASETGSSSSALAAAPAPPAAVQAGPAAIGAAAPDFTLADLDGKSVSLSQFKGKPVVLEWFNPGCPFVRAAHTAGSLKGMAEKHKANGVAWLAINSGGPGKQGNGVDANREAVTQFGMQHPVLIDESGAVGKQYGAERTPHMYVVNAEGVLVYRGAIDNSPDGEGQTPEGGKLVNYVEVALGALQSGTPVEQAETRPYGCSVKYKDL
jgi:peroxiredoxin